MTPSSPLKIVWFVPVITALAGCGEELTGSFFTVSLETAVDGEGELKDDCNDPPEASRQTYEYRLVLQGSDVLVYVGEDLLATGGLDVCTLSYQSTTWQTQRDTGSVRWAVTGEAQVGLGSGCNEGWQGTERLVVVDSSDPAIPGGCSVEYDATGTLDRVVD